MMIKLHRPQSVILLIGICTFALLSSACQSRITGKEGNLEFSYPTVDDFLDFNKPIAVGAKLDLSVAQANSRRNVILESAESSNEGVLKISGYSSNVIVLEGVGDGRAEIQVEAQLHNGDVVFDAVDMRARIPEVLRLKHYCTDETEGYYFTSSNILVPYYMELDNGQAVIGYGYHPVDIEPSDGLEIDQTSKDQRHFHIRTGSLPGSVTLSSQIDSTTLTLNLVEEKDIEGLTIFAENVKVYVDSTSFVGVRPMHNDQPICQARATVEIDNHTPELCTVATSDNDNGASTALSYWGIVSVRGLDTGECSFDVHYPNALDGQGVRETIALDVEPKRN